MHAQHCSAAATARQCSSSRPADTVQQRQRQARQQRSSSGVDRVPARAYQRLHWEINRQDDRSIGMKKKERKYKQPAETASSAATASACSTGLRRLYSCGFFFLPSQLSSNERARLSADSNNHRHCTQAKCYVVRAFQKWQFRWRLKASTVGVTILFSVATFTSSRNR